MTLLDQITVVSRTGESAIETMASVSHIDQEQLRRLMPTTPQGAFFGVPSVTVQSDAKRAASSVNIRGLQDFGRVAVIIDGARQDFQRSGHGTQSALLDRSGTHSADRRDPRPGREHLRLRARSAAWSSSRPRTPSDFLRTGETWAASATGRLRDKRSGMDDKRHGGVPVQRRGRRPRQYRLARLRRLRGR